MAGYHQFMSKSLVRWLLQDRDQLWAQRSLIEYGSTSLTTPRQIKQLNPQDKQMQSLYDKNKSAKRMDKEMHWYIFHQQNDSGSLNDSNSEHTVLRSNSKSKSNQILV